VARVLKMRDYTPAYIRTHSNIADQFTKIVDPVSFRRLRDWMANGLDDQWDGEVVEALEKIFQQCKMREMAERKAAQREQLKDKDKQASSKREQPASAARANQDQTEEGHLQDLNRLVV
jgi:hypothetical protein